MKATDLMIGDWVINADIPKQVLGVVGHKVLFLNGKTKMWYPIEACYPIPITPEILEKNGFKNSEWYGWQIKEPDFTLCFVGDTPHFLLDDIFVCDCPYVHTLQHALRLCGIDKEIVL